MLVEIVSELGGMSRYKVKRKIDIPSLQEVMGEVDKHELIKPETHGALKI